VLITIACPFCETRFQVDASLRGRQMRCPKADCREVFEVREVAPAPEPVIEGVPVPAAPPSQKAGRVEDMVPVLGAEVAAPPEGDQPQVAPPDWRKSPPPARSRGGAAAPPEPVAKGVAPPPALPRGAAAPPPPKRKPAAEAEPRTSGDAEKRGQSSAGPVELPPGAWEAPPVRGGAGVIAPPQGRKTALEMEAADKAARAKTRRNKALILAAFAVPFLLMVGGGGLAYFFLRDTEDRDRAEADRLYAEGQFWQASNQYGKLIEKYADSPNIDDYRFWQELSAVRGLPMQSNQQGAFDRVGNFLTDHKDDPRLADHGKEVGEAVVKLLEDAGKSAKENLHDAEVQAHFQRGQGVLDELRARGWVDEAKVAEVDVSRREVDKLLQQEKDRLALIEQLRALAQKPSAEAVRKMQDRLRDEAAKPTHFNQDPEVVKAENELYEKHRESITFTEEQAPFEGRRPAEDAAPGLLVQPLLALSGAGAPLPADRVVFALVRGVLYALRQSDGDVVWATRVGIDTAHLPLRVPPAGNTPELALVLSADTLTLTAVITSTGETLWKHRLGAASLGRPVLVERRVYVPTLDGEVREIELAGGRLLGRYKLGQSLSVGGTRLGETKLLFFPGDDSCVYVLDVGRRRCHAVLYTEHAAGLLRGEPILLPSEERRDDGQLDPNAPGYLVLSLEHGLDATLLRTFRLLPPDPRAEAGAKESRLRAERVDMPERRLRGWPWFPPHRDPEKLVTVTDAGVLGLFGIVQAANKDDPLFPLVRVPGADEGSVELPGGGSARGRAQVVHAQGDDLWVLARGRLLRHSLTLTEKGPKVVPHSEWGQPLDLGSPLHESQTDDAGTTLFLVTQSPNGRACLATAVDAETGHVRWQRQLGLVCHGDPLPLGDDVVALDQGGGLFLFDAKRHPDDAEAQWQSGGHGLAKPLPEGVTGSAYLIPGPDGKSVYEFTCPDPGKRLIVREYFAGRGAAAEHVFDDLPARLAGTPAVGPKRVLLPLADGSTRQLRLPFGAESSSEGPPWRASRVHPEAPGHAVWLGGDDFLTTNGQRGLTRWHFREGVIFEAVPEGKDAKKPTLELPERVAGAPAVLSRAGDGTVLRVCVADEGGTVVLFEGEDLKPARQWALKGPVTAGPFARGGMAGCVVGKRRLVWLDPAKDDPLWTYESRGEDIVGRPQVADGMVLVADLSGRFVGLDPATGQARGPGYLLRASVGPAATPVGFGPGRAFAPLTDGTVLLLPLHQLREPLPGLPPVW
jgi:outer membrane protein assembly factor BamB